MLRLLRAFECRNVTFMEPDGSWPIVWSRARGMNVWDLEDRKFEDWTAAFGVAAAGHANPRVIRAGQVQMETLPHAMGDVHPHAPKARLARELSRITFERWLKSRSQSSSPRAKGAARRATTHGKSIFCNSGFEAVEAALKTARLATGKRGIIAFEGAYHGVGYGTLSATHREHFRKPFENQLGRFGRFVPFPARAGDVATIERALRALLRRAAIGGILVEPIQARGGVRVPPATFLPMLRRVATEHRVLLIADEIYTGFGRTGTWFACEHWGVAPDILCLGKALTGGFPLSVCIGRADLMDAAWPPSTGEAIHTSTFLGNPVGCAMALAQLRQIRLKKLPARSARMGRRLLRQLRELKPPPGFRFKPRGLGLMAGLELCRRDGSPAAEETFRVIKAMLHRGFILLPEGSASNVIAFTPPLIVSERHIDRCARTLDKVLRAELRP